MNRTTLIALQKIHELRELGEHEDGFSTAELLGNAALGIVALVVIWTGLKAIGLDVVDMVRGEILGG